MLNKIIKFLRNAYFYIGLQDCKQNTLLGKLNKLVHVYFLKVSKVTNVNTSTNYPKIQTYPPPTNDNQLATNSSPNILIFKLDHIGDFISAIPAIFLLKKHWPKSKIDLVCRDSLISFASRLNIFRSIYSLNYIPDSEHLHLKNSYTNNRPIFPPGLIYDLAVDFNHSGETLSLLNDAPARHKAGFDVPNSPFAFDIVLPPMEWKAIFPRMPAPPQAKDRLVLLSTAVISRFTPLRLTWQSPYKKDKTSVSIGISIGSGSSAKKWKTSYVSEIICLLREKISNTRFFLYGGKEDIEDGKAILANLPPGTDITNHIGSIDISMSADLISTLDLFIGYDTGLTHLASSLSIPTVDIFSGVSNVPIWSAQGENTCTIFVMETCTPCYIRTSSECIKSMPCINNITPSSVLPLCLELLNK